MMASASFIARVRSLPNRSASQGAWELTGGVVRFSASPGRGALGRSSSSAVPGRSILASACPRVHTCWVSPAGVGRLKARGWLIGRRGWLGRDASSVLLLVALSLIVTLSTVYYVRQRSALIDAVDVRLRTAAEAALELNGGALLDERVAAGAIDPRLYLEDARRNYAFTSRTGLAYVYGLVLDGATPLFVFDTAAPGDAGAEEITSPLEAYGSAPPAVLQAFQTGKPQFVEYTDRWGTFRSIFLPARSPGGVEYVVGADIRFSDVRALLKRLLLETLLIGGVAVVATLAFARVRSRALMRSREQLQASEGRARRIVDAIPDPVFVIDRSDVIVDCRSDDLEPQFALPSEALIGRRVDEVFGEPIGRLLHEAAGRARAGSTVERVDFELPLGSGSPTYEARVVAIDQHATLALARDVTERTELQRSLAEQNEQLKTLDRMKDEFLALVSHELRTPLTSILGYVELLLEEPALDPGHRHYVEVVDRNAHRLLRLVGDLLLLAHLESGRLELARSTVDLAAVATSALESQRPRAAAAGVEVTLTAEPVPQILADHARLEQLADNLLSNAIKYTPPGGRVHLHVGRTADGDALLEVADTGIGIPEHEQRQLFERFFRASTAKEQQIPGTGLGLTIAKAIAEAHDGDIYVRSAPGEGTTVGVTIPADQRLTSAPPLTRVA